MKREGFMEFDENRRSLNLRLILAVGFAGALLRRSDVESPMRAPEVQARHLMADATVRHDGPGAASPRTAPMLLDQYAR